MKRSNALAQLSRDHHRGLVVARQLNGATRATASAARDAFLAFWEQEGREHFRVEEDVLLPAFARHGSPADEAALPENELIALAAAVELAHQQRP
jgi:hypothetical protein